MNNENQNQTVIFEPVIPHPQPVATGELLTDIENTIKRHVVLSDAAATALAVWVLHTYVYELRDTVAYVAIESPEKRCGKTTLLTVLAAMANKDLIASNVTVGALFRAIDSCRPTLFIDEADTFLAGNGVMRGIINSGNTVRTAFVLRLARTKQSRDREGASNTGPIELAGLRGQDSAATVGQGGMNGERAADIDSRSLTVAARLNQTGTGLQRYSCWCPKVVAMIGNVPDTIADRSIVVHMRRKLVSEKRAPLAALNTGEIKAKCARFAQDNGDAIAVAEKIHGEGLNDRAADTFDPLYVIARLAGQEWEQKLHAAALALGPNAPTRSSAVDLLLDVYTVFVMNGQKRIFTRNLIEAFRDEYYPIRSAVLKKATMDEHAISQLLRPYGIRPSICRIGKRVGRGYKSEDFADVLERYVPPAELESRRREIEEHQKLWEESEEFAENAGVVDSGTMGMEEEEDADRR